jgi:hypothetical protein
MLISIAVCVPYLLSFLTSLQTVLFSSSRGNPGFFILIWVLMVEIGQTLGIVIFLFKVLPQTGNITGLLLMGGVCIVPSILKVIFSSHRGMTRFKKMITFIFDILAIVCQASVWVVFIFVKNFDNGLPKKNDFELFLILSTSLISLGWWENFAQVRFTTNRVSYFIQNQINELRKYNAKIYLLVNAAKIVCTFMFSYVMMTKNMQEQYINFKNQINFTANKDLLLTANLNLESKKLIEEDVFFKNATVYFPFMLHVISTAVCFFTGRTACKVLMQRLGFSLPLVLSTPATLLLVIILSIKNDLQPITVYAGPLQDFLYLDHFDS